MKTTKSALLFAILAVATAGTAACSDTGDNNSSADSGADGTMPGDDGSVGSDTGSGGDTGSGMDSTMPGQDSATPEASADTGSPEDTGSTDSSQSDSTVESGGPDTGMQDAPVDTGTDVTSQDTGTPDTGMADTGMADTGMADTGMADTGMMHDTGTDTGSDSGTPAIFNAHCAVNKSGAPCTATELLLIEKDTNPDGTGKGGATPYGCYDCLGTAGCIDDTNFASDVDHECGDTDATGITQPTLSGHPATQVCLNVLSCVLGGNCATTLGSGTCYCGTAVASNCNTTGLPNGACVMQEQDGTDTTTPATVNSRFTAIAYAAGMANTIFSCAASNSCGQCFP
jgi:hypothetical protein